MAAQNLISTSWCFVFLNGNYANMSSKTFPCFHERAKKIEVIKNWY